MKRAVSALSLALLLPLAACGGGDEGASAGSDGGTLTVLAAASLTDVFNELADAVPAARVLPIAITPAGGEGEDEDKGEGGDGTLHFGTSTTTLVDLTLAMARTPGSRPSSSAASLLISDTTR